MVETLKRKVIAVVGDIHGDIDGLYAYLEGIEQRTGIKIDHVIHVGDFGVYLPPDYQFGDGQWDRQYPFRKYWDGEKVAPYDTRICPGNHEEWQVLKWWTGQPHRLQNMHLIPNGGVVELEVGQAKFRIGAVWGNYSYKSYRNPQRIHAARRDNPHSPKANHIEAAAVERLKREGGKLDMLITHDAPEGMMPVFGQPPQFTADQLGIDRDERAKGCEGFNEIHKVNQPRVHYFGHFHTRRIVNPAKYPVLVECLHCFNYNKDAAVQFLELEEVEEYPEYDVFTDDMIVYKVDIKPVNLNYLALLKQEIENA